MSKTSEFKWDFGSGGTRDRNSASSAALNFSAAGRYISFVRESIQNSLDFPLNINAPVEMTFSLSEISSEDYPELFELGDHIRDCKEISIENPRAHKEYTAMERRFFPNGTQVGTLKVLTVSDYNTLGMYYDTTNEKSKVASPFYCFALSEGSSRKFGPGPAGGSFGFGKNAYFSMSPFKTLIVSTKVGEGAFKGRQFMLGVSALISHLHEGKKVSDYGCFGVKTNPLEPVSDVNMIPRKFRRDRPGTDMHIIGTYGETDHEIFTNLKRAVLNHFWLAILDKKLEVTVGGEKITAENLSEVIQKTFNSEVETGWASNYDGWCPIAYFDALVEGRKPDTARDPLYYSFEKELPLIGKCHLYLHACEGGKDRIAYIRGLRMVVEKKEHRTGYGYYGVFFCDDQQGNKLLGQLEPFEHNSWDKKNWQDDATGKVCPDAHKIMGALETFVVESVNKVFSKEDQMEIPIPGLNALLGGDSVDTDPYGAGDNAGDNSEQGEHEIWNTTRPLSAAKGVDDQGISKLTMVLDNKVVYRDPAGTTTIVVKTKHTSGDGGKIKPKPGKKKKSVKLKDGSEHPCVLEPVELHVLNPSDLENGHLVVFKLSKPIEKAFVKFEAGTDNGITQKGELSLLAADVNGKKADVFENTIQSVPLQAGNNQMLVTFNDGMRHSLEVEIYELQDK